MTERELRHLIGAVKAGHVSRRAFMRRMVGLGLSAPFASLLLSYAGVVQAAVTAEEFRVGGTCVIRGCVPKKLLVYAARMAGDFEDAAGFGWSVPEPVFDWPTLIANKDKEIARLEVAYRANLARLSVEIAETRAIVEEGTALAVVELLSGQRAGLVRRA